MTFTGRDGTWCLIRLRTIVITPTPDSILTLQTIHYASPRRIWCVYVLKPSTVDVGHWSIFAVREHFSSPLLQFSEEDAEKTFTLVECPSMTYFRSGYITSRLIGVQVEQGNLSLDWPTMKLISRCVSSHSTQTFTHWLLTETQCTYWSFDFWNCEWVKSLQASRKLCLHPAELVTLNCFSRLSIQGLKNEFNYRAVITGTKSEFNSIQDLKGTTLGISRNGR